MRDLEKVTFMLENFQNIMLDVPKQDWTLKELLDAEVKPKAAPEAYFS